MKTLLSLLLSAGIMSLATTLRAAEPHVWTLQECISHALAHNISIQQQQDAVQQQQISLSTTRHSRLPNLQGSAGEHFSFGRALTSDNTYANRNTSSTSFSLGTSVPIYTGGQIPTETAIRRLNLQAALQDCQQAKDNITLAVISAYLEAVYQQDLVEIARQQVELSQAQAERMQQLCQAGKAAEADVAQMRSMQASDQLSLTQQQGSLKLALLELSQLLELDTPEGFSVQRPLMEDASETLLPTPDAIYNEALGVRPQILAGELRMRSAEKNIRLAKSALYPSLHLSAGLGSNYYRTNGYDTPSFGRQLRDNFSQYLGVSLSVPIFNRMATLGSIRSARVQLHTQQLQLQDTKKTLYKDIQQAYYNALNAQQQCRSSQEANNYALTAHQLMQAKYEQGRANATEYQEAKHALQKARSQHAQALYTFLFRQKILLFYRGN